MYFQAVESFLKGDYPSIISTCRAYGLKRTTFHDFVQAAREGKSKIWSGKGSVCKVFTSDEEEEVKAVVLHSDPKLTLPELQNLLKEKLLAIVAVNPERKTGYEKTGQELPVRWIKRFVRRLGVSECLRKLTDDWKLFGEQL